MSSLLLTGLWPGPLQFKSVPSSLWSKWKVSIPGGLFPIAFKHIFGIRSELPGCYYAEEKGSLAHTSKVRSLRPLSFSTSGRGLAAPLTL